MNERHAPDGALRAILDGGGPNPLWEEHLGACDHCAARLAKEAAVEVMARALSAPERRRPRPAPRDAKRRWARASASALVVGVLAGFVLLGAAPAGSSPINSPPEELSGGTPVSSGEEQALRNADGVRLASLDAGARDALRAR